MMACKQYSTNPEAKKAITREQYITCSTNPEMKKQLLINNMMVLIRKQKRQPLVSKRVLILR